MSPQSCRNINPSLRICGWLPLEQKYQRPDCECSCKSVWFCLISPAEQQNGSAIILEHRFYGLSNPIDNLKTESLKLHTIQQAIDDLEYFAKNVVLPQPDGDQVTPDKTPWILAGGSYSGAYIKTVVSM